MRVTITRRIQLPEKRASPPPEEQEEMREVQRCAYRRSVALLCDPDCLTDPVKRSAFVAARLQYQDATFALAAALSADGADGTEAPRPHSVPLCPTMDR